MDDFGSLVIRLPFGVPYAPNSFRGKNINVHAFHGHRGEVLALYKEWRKANPELANLCIAHWEVRQTIHEDDL